MIKTSPRALTSCTCLEIIQLFVAAKIQQLEIAKVVEPLEQIQSQRVRLLQAGLAKPLQVVV